MPKFLPGDTNHHGGRCWGLWPLVLALLAAFAACGQPDQATSSSETKGIVESESMYGWWNVAQLDGEETATGIEILVGATPAISFGTPGRLDFAIFTTCNRLSGSYTVIDGVLSVSRLVRAAILCGGEDTNQDVHILEGILQEGSSAKLVNGELHLGDEPRIRARLVRSSRTPVHAIYRVASLSDRAFESPVVIQLEGDSFTVFAGCYYSGTIVELAGISELSTPILQPGCSESGETAIPVGPDNDVASVWSRSCEGEEDLCQELVSALGGARLRFVNDQVQIESTPDHEIVLKVA